MTKLWDDHKEKEEHTESANIDCAISDPKPPQVPPEVVTEGATGVTRSEATLRGTVKPNGLEIAKYGFEWGPGESYSDKTPLESWYGKLQGNKEVSAHITALAAGTTYHYRLVVYGDEARGESIKKTGEPREFKTAPPGKPAATTEPASYVNSFEPQLNATINPEGADTHYQFEYDTKEYKRGEGSHGTKVPATAQDIGAGEKALSVSQTLGGLERNKTYYFRVVAENKVGGTYGEDESFTTLPFCKGTEAKCEWSFQSAADPTPESEYRLEGVSCPSSTMCMAVGTDSYRGVGFAEAWEGGEWKIKATQGTEMNAVSCVSATWCMAIGKFTTGDAWQLRRSKCCMGRGSWKRGRRRPRKGQRNSIYPVSRVPRSPLARRRVTTPPKNESKPSLIGGTVALGLNRTPSTRVKVEQARRC